ncbi:hypothetical protein GGTG_05179 [Gaeumannomyces tritici R3-111a-1]|uniref:LysM domain-containing protein n=1 Tax=Gaeumannomyces tritici (strain R3-111a-1) TaxID=644352 RepID=J3NV66_GAET3|nr:hypothetical protein GGTG_05179 [Gaeumannomyces tritici R3-111a-1]EJT75242.1 hypothetical protein GGTG_05179 [Gaeumannomyces tritici R3-111a-1]
MANFGGITTSVLTGAYVAHMTGISTLALAQQPRPVSLPNHEACTRWHRAQPGDSCASVQQGAGLTAAQLGDLNADVAKLCGGGGAELTPGAWLCLASAPRAKKKTWWQMTPQERIDKFGPRILQSPSSSSSSSSTSSPTAVTSPVTHVVVSYPALDVAEHAAPADDVEERDEPTTTTQTLESHHHPAPLPPSTLTSVPRMRRPWFAMPKPRLTAAAAAVVDLATTTVTRTYTGTAPPFTGPGDGATAWPSSFSSVPADQQPGKTALPINSTTTSTVVTMVDTLTSFVPVMATATTNTTVSPLHTVWRRNDRRRQQATPTPTPQPDGDDSDNNEPDTHLLPPDQAARCARREPTSQTAILQFAAPAVRHQQLEEEEGEGDKSDTPPPPPPPLLPRPAAIEHACARATIAPIVLLPPSAGGSGAADDNDDVVAAAALAVITASPATTTMRPPHVYLSSACSCLGHFDRSRRVLAAAAAAAADDVSEPSSDTDADKTEAPPPPPPPPHHDLVRRRMGGEWVSWMLNEVAKTATRGYYGFQPPRTAADEPWRAPATPPPGAIHVNDAPRPPLTTGRP